MKKLLFFPLFFLQIFIFANPVDIQTAKQVGLNFLLSNVKQLETEKNLQLELADIAFFNDGEVDLPLYYVFNYGTIAYVIVAGDDRCNPVWAYSDNGSFNPNNMPPSFQSFLESYKLEIRSVIEQNLVREAKVATLWQEYFSGQNKLHQNASKAGTPLLGNIQYGQSGDYSVNCPDNCAAGCVATAMALVMRYWQFPTRGVGSNSYIPYAHPEYGTLSADFGNTVYNWDSMPNTIVSSTSQNQKDEIAKLIYHCGIALKMDYCSSMGTLSAAYTSQIAYALKTYFKYSSDAQCLLKDNNWSDIAWINMLKNQIDNSMPVAFSIYFRNHAVVLDGYDNNNLFHINWGGTDQSQNHYGAVTGTNNQAIINVFPLIYTVSGTITLNGNPLAGVTLSCPDCLTQTEITDPNGYYEFKVEKGLNVKITPTLAAYIFTPSDTTINNVSQNIDSIDFVATPSYIVSGNVTNNGNSLAGVKLSCPACLTQTETTDQNGYYEFVVTEGTQITITPTLTNYKFAPTDTTFSNIMQDIYDVNFVATSTVATINGKITSNGNSLVGVILSCPNCLMQKAITNINGEYSFTIIKGINAQITPSLANYTFTPSDTTVNNVTVNIYNVDFIATPTYTVSGKVTNKGNGLENLTISYAITSGNSAKTSVSTNAQGQYTIENIPEGADITITPDSGNYRFTPSYTLIQNITQNTENVNFVTKSVFIATHNIETITFFPNPANEILTFSSETTFEITDMNGKVLLKSNKTVKTINIKNLSAGIYFIKIGNKVDKFTKE